MSLEMTSWSGLNCLRLAHACGHQELMAHPCSQWILSDIWMGRLHTRPSVNLAVILTVLFPPLIFVAWHYKQVGRQVPREASSHSCASHFTGVSFRANILQIGFRSSNVLRSPLFVSIPFSEDDLCGLVRQTGFPRSLFSLKRKKLGNWNRVESIQCMVWLCFRKRIRASAPSCAPSTTKSWTTGHRRRS